MSDIKITWDIENCEKNSCASNPVQPAGAPKLVVDGKNGEATDAEGFDGELKYKEDVYATYTKECGRGGDTTGDCQTKINYTVGTITTDYLPKGSGEIIIEFNNKDNSLGPFSPPGKTSYIQIQNDSTRQIRVRYVGEESLVCPNTTTKFTVGDVTTFKPLKKDDCQ